MPIPSERKTEISYSDALNNEACHKEATASILHRLSSHEGINKTQNNIATVTLTFPANAPVPEVNIQMTVESAGRGLLGHSERRALALAINWAIDNQVKEFSGLRKFVNTINPASEEFEAYKEVLKSLKEIRFYTERVPCTRSIRPNDSCDVFFSKLLEGGNYHFYYSVSLMSGEQMTNNLQRQAKDAQQYLKTHATELSSQMQKLRSDLIAQQNSLPGDPEKNKEYIPLRMSNVHKIRLLTKQFNQIIQQFLSPTQTAAAFPQLFSKPAAAIPPQEISPKTTTPSSTVSSEFAKGFKETISHFGDEPFAQQLENAMNEPRGTKRPASSIPLQDSLPESPHETHDLKSTSSYVSTPSAAPKSPRKH